MRILVLVLALILSGCASYSSSTKKGRSAFFAGNYEEAATAFQEGAAKDGINQLLFLLDRGVVHHTAGNYELSNKDLLKADDLSDIKDYTSISRQAATIITNDRIVPYKGEEFETVMISTYLAINFALQKNYESALVEARKVNRKLEKLRTEAKRDYKFNSFARYLSGLLYEATNDWNNAYIDYKKVFETHPGFAPLKFDLLRGAMYIGSSRDKQRWREEFSATPEDFAAAKKLKQTHGSIVVIYQNGVAPQKIPSPNWHEIPIYKKRHNSNQAADIFVDGNNVATTQVLYDVEGAAISNLEQKYAAIVAKRIAGVAAREVIGHQVGKATDSEGLGFLVKAAMAAASQADTRGWYTLPQNLQMARIYRKPGRYEVKLKVLGHDASLNPEIPLGEAVIEKPGQVVFFNYRSFQ